jgi:hypothetical protein
MQLRFLDLIWKAALGLCYGGEAHTGAYPQTALLRLWDSLNNALRACPVELGEHETRR